MRDAGDPALGLGATLPLLVAGAFLMQFMVQGAWGVIPAHINELSPDQVRGFLPGFAYQCGVAIAGTVAYLQALFTDVLHVRYAWAMALVAVTVFSMAAVVTGVGPERSGRCSARTNARSGGDLRVVTGTVTGLPIADWTSHRSPTSLKSKLRNPESPTFSAASRSLA